MSKPPLIAHEEWVGSDVVLHVQSPLTKEITKVALTRDEHKEYMEWRTAPIDYDIHDAFKDSDLTEDEVELLRSGVSAEEYEMVSKMDDATAYEDIINERAGFTDPPAFLKGE